ncbi:hypothetical protein K1720_05515 [Thermococcus argininiproducens]|uniref:Uncharacterized protein n=1 Tax=Thermococcus argininiproducens TaxID=2866384 RepID=A0A9E7M8E2_9EURY|nr:hypothetical protein [Thermococcus argininiproducens]USG99015.1 hypothetical protein K1720_05515 [Thermococcus argininiproducens]
MPVPNREITDKDLATSLMVGIIVYVLIQVYTRWYSNYLKKKEEELKEHENIGELY